MVDTVLVGYSGDDRLCSMPLALAVLNQCSLFSGLPPDLARFCSEHMRLVSLRRREAVADNGAGEGLGFTGLGLVLSGAVQAVDVTGDGREAALVTCLPFECFGLAELLAPQGLPLTWIASASSTAVGLMDRGPALQAFSKAELLTRAAALLAQRVCDAQSLQKVLTVHPVSARVCAWLQWQQDGEGGGVTVPTHAELAWQLNTTRESVTRVFQKLLTDGVVEREGDRWRIAMPGVLADWARAKGKE
jgi:CRP-like cAMP-binding protein